MNCDEALSLLYEMIDKEASEVDTRELQKHFDKCGDCFKKYELQRSVHEFIQERLQNGSAADAHARLKMRIRLRLDEIDEGTEETDQPQANRGTPRPFRLPAVALAAAASIVILIGAAYFGTSFYTHQKLYLPLEQSHWTDQAREFQPMSESDLSLALSEASTQYHYQLRPTINNFQLVSGHPEDLMGQSMMHYVYANDARKVSVFLAPAAFFARYADSDMEKVVRDSLTLFDHHCRGCRLVFHRDGDLLVVTASTDKDVELLDFIPGRAAI